MEVSSHAAVAGGRAAGPAPFGRAAGPSPTDARSPRLPRHHGRLLRRQGRSLFREAAPGARSRRCSTSTNAAGWRRCTMSFGPRHSASPSKGVPGRGAERRDELRVDSQRPATSGCAPTRRLEEEAWPWVTSPLIRPSTTRRICSPSAGNCSRARAFRLREAGWRWFTGCGAGRAPARPRALSPIRKAAWCWSNYAHSDDALSRVLEAVRPRQPATKAAAVVCVFGLRRPIAIAARRPLMGAAAGARANPGHRPPADNPPHRRSSGDPERDRSRACAKKRQETRSTRAPPGALGAQKAIASSPDRRRGHRPGVAPAPAWATRW